MLLFCVLNGDRWNVDRVLGILIWKLCMVSCKNVLKVPSTSAFMWTTPQLPKSWRGVEYLMKLYEFLQKTLILSCWWVVALVPVMKFRLHIIGSFVLSLFRLLDTFSNRGLQIQPEQNFTSANYTLQNTRRIFSRAAQRCGGFTPYSCLRWVDFKHTLLYLLFRFECPKRFEAEFPGRRNDA